MLGTVGIGMVWAFGKWGFRKMGVGERVVEGGEREVVASREGVRKDGQWRDVQGTQSVALYVLGENPVSYSGGCHDFLFHSFEAILIEHLLTPSLPRVRGYPSIARNLQDQLSWVC
jgi:hypothetical protein